MPAGYAQNPGSSAYQKKYEKAAEKERTWRTRVFLGLCMLLFVILSLILGVAGIVLAAGVLSQDSESDEEL